MGPKTGQSRKGVLVWDLPLRVFHWLLAAAFAVSFYTGIAGGLEAMDWHQRSGYLILALLMFRLLWGFLGTRHARFRSFLTGPSAVMAYAAAMVRGRPEQVTGHNPLAACAICITLLALLVQAVTGLFARDNLFTEGPLVHLVDSDTASIMTWIHGWGQWTLGILVALHLLAIILHRLVYGERLVGPMITGRSLDAAPSEGIASQRLLLATGLAAGVALAVWWIVTRL